MTVAVAVTAAGNPTQPDRPALSRIRPTDVNLSDGQAGRPPPQCPPTLIWFRNRGRPEHAENRAPSGCRVRHCAGTTTRLRPAPRTMALPGSPGELDAVCSPGYEAGRRRTIGVVAALPASHARPRRWCDAGAPGRIGVTAAQKAGAEGMARNHSSALCCAHVSGAMKPTRVGTPPSPAGRWRYKHRSALCCAHVSGATEPTRVGTPPSPAGRRRYKHRSTLCGAHVSGAMKPTRIGTPPGSAIRSAAPATKQAADRTQWKGARVRQGDFKHKGQSRGRDARTTTVAISTRIPRMNMRCKILPGSFTMIA